MKVDQTLYGDQGNCMAASVATVLGRHLREVPDLRGVHWLSKLRKWAEQQGYSVELWRALPSNYSGMSIGLGDGPRGRGHAVVYRGLDLWHDPHPSRAGLIRKPHRYLVFGAG